MTELREPPLLSDEEIIQVLLDNPIEEMGLRKTHYQCIVQAQREADIKWMKEHCYLKAERELPELTFGWNEYNIIGGRVQQNMLKAGFKAVGRWE